MVANFKNVKFTEMDKDKVQVEGATRSLSVDMHGKGLSSYLLDMEICLLDRI